jgi:hypothetical protein
MADDRIVYCRDIDPSTVLHLSTVGDGYLLRRFDGTDPFSVDEKPTHESLRVCYRFPLDRPLSEEEAKHPVADAPWWRKHFAELNQEILGHLPR